MTLKEIYEKHGAAKVKASGFSYIYTIISQSKMDANYFILEWCSGVGKYEVDYFSEDSKRFDLYTEPKKKIKRWLWACKTGENRERIGFINWLMTEEEAKDFYKLEPIIKLPWSETEFDE